MRRAAALAMLCLGLWAADGIAAEPPAPRHPLSEGSSLRDIVPPKPEAEKPAPVTGPATPPKEPVERRSRQPTMPPRIEPNAPPEKPAPIETRDPVQRPEKPKPPIGTIDPRPGTIRTFPGTIEAR